jgi:MinD-like ATPase involved in chromosome partitioning or flagellar assembly
MSIPVLTAVSDSRWEAEFVSALARGDHDVEVVRRCVDIADLLAAAAAGIGRVVLLSGDLRRLDREALTRLAAAGVAVVGLVRDEPAERRLRQLGVGHVLADDAQPAEVIAALIAAVGTGPVVPGHALADPGAALPPPPRTAADAAGSGSERPAGRLVAVWGPTGAPGRSSVALGLAAELAELGISALLVDADGYGGVAAQLLGLLDEAPGLAAACRLANNGTLDLPGLAELAVEVRPGLCVLTGIARADRWPELRPTGLEVVLDMARRLADVTVVDCSFCLERDEELSFDTAAPRRNGATLTALAAADTVVAVASGDPVGLQRLVRGLGELADAVPGVTPMTVVNRVRPAAVGGGQPELEISAALERFAGLRDIRFVPLDLAAFDAAVALGRTLPETAPSSPARLALQSIAASLIGRPTPRPRGKLFARRR